MMLRVYFLQQWFNLSDPGVEERFESRLLPLFVRRTETVAGLLPSMYLHGLSLGDVELARRGARRCLVKDRIDIAGARWRLTSAEAVLKLRSLHSSGGYWDFHKALELKRSHSSPIKNCLPLEAA